MTGDNSTRKRAGAVFFAAIMVVSMVGVGFAGSVAATDASVTATQNSVEVGQGESATPLNLEYSDSNNTDGEQLTIDNITLSQASGSLSANDIDQVQLQIGGSTVATASSVDDLSSIQFGGGANSFDSSNGAFSVGNTDGDNFDELTLDDGGTETIDVVVFAASSATDGDLVFDATTETDNAPEDFGGSATEPRSSGTFTVNNAADGELIVDGDDGEGEYDTIQNAIDNATDGDNIVVQDYSSGTYSGFTADVTNLNIEAADGASPTVTADSGLAVDVTASPVTVDGFTINGADGENVIDTADTGTTTISNNTINPSTGGASDVFAIAADNTVTVESNTISEGSSTEAFGIRTFGNADGSTISDNSFENLRVGIQTENDGNIEIDSNSFSSITASGVYALANSGDVSTDYTVTNNDFTDVGNAVDVQTLNSATFSGAVEVTNNNFENAAGYEVGGEPLGAVEVREDGESITEVNATLNWWGDSSGPSGEGFGSGDAINNVGSAAVTFTPWLDAAAPDGESTPVITTSPSEVVDGDAEEISVTIENHPQGENPTAAITVPDGKAATDFTRTVNDDGTFTFIADASGSGVAAGDNFEIDVDYSGGDAGTVSDAEAVSVRPDINFDLTFETDPASPVYNDVTTVSGALDATYGNGTDANASVGQIELRYENGDSDGSEAVKNTLTGSENLFNDQFTADDAGTYTFYVDSDESPANDGLSGDYEVELGNFTVDSQQGNLTLSTAAEDPVAGDTNTEDYTVTLEDADGNAVNLASGDYSPASADSYVNVTGPFPSGAVTEGGNVLAVVNNEAGDIAYFHAQTDSNGEYTFTADALGDVSASLEFDDGEDVYTGGVEDTTSVSTPATLDLVDESDSVAVGTGDNLNIDTSGSDSLSVDGTNQTVDVSVTGSDFNEVGAMNSNLDYANITISSDALVGASSQSITVNQSEDETTPVQFTPLNFTEGGEVLVEVTAEEREDGETVATYTSNTTLDVAGDQLTDLSPTEVTAGDEQDLTVQVSDLDENVEFERTVTLTHSQSNGFNVSGSTSDTVTLTSSDFSTSQNAFVRENVTFELPGTVDLTVEESGPTTTVDVSEAITVSGEERYDISTDDELLVGSNDELNFTVTDLDSGEQVTDETTLDELATSLTLQVDGSDIASTGTANVDTANNSIVVSNVRADTTDTVNATVSTDGGAFEGSGTVNVVEPEITTELAGDSLTEGVTSENVTITVEDPRDGSGVEGELRLSENGTAVNVVNDAQGVDTDAIDGSPVTLALDANGTVDATLTPDAISDADNTTLALDVSPESDSTYVGATDVDAGDLQIAERESGQDVELREEIAFDSEEDVTFILRDANDARIDARAVNVTGTSFADTTDEGFFAINFAEETLEEGSTLNFNVSSDYEGGAEEITAATVDVTEDLEEVQLTANVTDDSVEQGENFDFTVDRGDFNENTQANLSFVNASDEEALSANTGEVDTANYGVVDTSDLEPGDYTVEVTKGNTDTKTFVSDTVNVTVEEPPTSEIDVNVTSVEPAEPDTSATYNADVTFTNVEDETAQFVSVDFGDQDVNLSNVDADSLGVNQPDGSSLDIANLYRGDSTEGLDNSTLVIELGDTIADANENDTYTVSVPDVDNGDAGEYTLTLGLHESGDEILGAAAPAFAADSDSYTIGETTTPGDATFNVSEVAVASNVDGEAAQGETVNITATVTNTGDAAGTQNVSLMVGGEELTVIEDVELDSGANTTVYADVALGTVQETGTLSYSVSTADDSASANIEVFELGDANHDGSIGSGDVTLMQQYIVGFEIDQTFNPAAADLTRSGDVGSADATLNQQQIVNIDPGIEDTETSVVDSGTQ